MKTSERMQMTYEVGNSWIFEKGEVKKYLGGYSMTGYALAVAIQRALADRARLDEAIANMSEILDNHQPVDDTSSNDYKER